MSHTSLRLGAKPLAHLGLSKERRGSHVPVFTPREHRRWRPSGPRRKQWRRQDAFGEMPPWTLDQIVGLAFGGLMVVFYYSSQLVDAYVARSQRRALGICEECGGIGCPFCEVEVSQKVKVSQTN